MNRPFVWALTLSMVGGAWLAAQPPAADKPSVKVQGLEVHKPLPPDVHKQFEGIYYGNTGIVMQLLVSLPNKQILTIDTKASKLTSLTDDKGTDLTKSAMAGAYTPPWLEDYGNQVSKDKKNLIVRTQNPGTTAPGASKIAVKATLAVICGTEEKTVEAKNVELKVDKTTKLGALILSTEKAFGGNNTNVAFICEDAPRIKSVTFLDKDGQALRSFPAGFGPNFGVGRKDWICRYSIDGKVDQVTVRVIYYEKLETVNVPVELQVGVGF